MDILATLKIAASGLRAQSGRMRVIAENLANAESTAPAPGADPYRRKMLTFAGALDRETGAAVVRPERVVLDRSEFRMRYEPGHPAADEKGYVRLPNVNSLVETMDMREAQRSYEANLNVITTTRRMLARTLDILRG